MINADVLGVIVAVLSALVSLVWWAYRWGWTAGIKQAEDTAKIAFLERLLADTRAQLASIQPRGTDGPSVPE
jgi:hypothetical protein